MKNDVLSVFFFFSPFSDCVYIDIIVCFLWFATNDLLYNTALYTVLNQAVFFFFSLKRANWIVWHLSDFYTVIVYIS